MENIEQVIPNVGTRFYDHKEIVNSIFLNPDNFFKSLFSLTLSNSKYRNKILNFRLNW